MKTYIALLRGINVSGQKKIKMADLRDALEKGNLKNVKTYIQSGNIVFDSAELNNAALEDKIKDVILTRFGFEVPTMVVTGSEIEAIIKANPFVNKTEESNLYFVLLKQSPAKEHQEEFNQLNFVNEDFHVTNTCVYLCCEKGYGKAKLDNNFVERKLKVQATTRNLKTMNKLVEMTKS
ncbi:DUF1697 domain-containing protein [Flagellimonas pacifica]|uniref:Uncharacterized conserved protein, DUF1697 family n=1 Tax=Flagellimonas pacifica TaxID=1247520 RepID=A0A285MBM6_9FLAO|nr:DUF1697 domain-containing protein [Allomuricauda parva]SNY94565.1 Uncharacterized conserved protein, DUF1697 family [Allomuricauda parva]